MRRGAWLVGLCLLTACTRPSADPATVPVPVDTPTIPPTVDSSTPTPTPTPQATETLIPIDPGYITFPSLVGDAGNFSVLPGPTTLLWEFPPPDAMFYTIIAFYDDDSVAIATSLNDSGELIAEWSFPPGTSGYFRGVATLADDREVWASSGDWYSLPQPPEGVCSLVSRSLGGVELFAAPDESRVVVGYLQPLMVAFELTDDGWLHVRVEGDAADMLEAGIESAWVAPEAHIEMLGPCEDLPAAP